MPHVRSAPHNGAVPMFDEISSSPTEAADHCRETNPRIATADDCRRMLTESP